MTIVKTLKALYERLGGTPSDVANATRAVDVLNAIAALYGGASNATHIAKAIANIVAVASGLIKPSGTKSITANGSDIDVKEYAAVDVSVPQPSGTISITSNGTGIDVSNYATADVNVETYEAMLTNLIEREITSIDIPQGVTTIGIMAFSNCRNLESINISSTVTSIGDGALQATALTTVNIPEGVTSIGANAFDNCQDLTSVYIPVSMTNIGAFAFVSDNALADIYYAGTQTQWDAITMGRDAIPADATVHYEYTPT